jgi:hypothetical protein
MKIPFSLYRYIKVEYIIYVLIILGLTSGWLNNNLPTGLDTLGGFQLFDYVRDTFFTQGLLPSWSPYWYVGHPVWYTLSFLIFSLVSGSIFLYKFVWIIIFILSGIFLYELSFMFIKDRASSFVAGLIYLFIPYHVLMVSYSGAGAFNVLFALLPLTFLLLEKTLQKPVVKNLILLGFCIAAVILSYPQAILLVGTFITFYALFRLLWIKHSRTNEVYISSRRSARHTFWVIFGSLLIGLLLSMYWWLPYLQELSSMSQIAFSISEINLRSSNVIEVLILRTFPFNIPSFSLSGISIYTTIITLVIPVLAFFGLSCSFKNKYGMYISLSGLICLTLAMGISSPIFIFAFSYVPFFNSIRQPDRFLLYASLCFALLAGFGVKELLTRFRTKIKRLLILIICSLIILNSCFEMYRGFSTYELGDDQKNAMTWLATNAKGSLIIPFPQRGWLQIDDENDRIVNPWYYTSLTKARTLNGGSTMHSVRNNTSLTVDQLIDEKSNLYCMNYLVFDNNLIKYFDQSSRESVTSAYDRVSTSNKFVKVWAEGNVVIFKNTQAFPEIYLRYADTSTGKPCYSLDNASIDQINMQMYKIRVNATQPSLLIFAQSYFPNWVAEDIKSGDIIRAQSTSEEYCAFQIDKGEHEFIIYYESTLQQDISSLVSISVLFLCLGYLIQNKIKQKYVKNQKAENSAKEI